MLFDLSVAFPPAGWPAVGGVGRRVWDGARRSGWRVYAQCGGAGPLPLDDNGPVGQGPAGAAIGESSPVSAFPQGAARMYRVGPGAG